MQHAKSSTAKSAKTGFRRLLDKAQSLTVFGQDQDAPSIAKHRTSARVSASPAILTSCCHSRTLQITSKAKRNATSRKGIKTSKTSRAGRSQIDPDSDAEPKKKAKIVFESDQEEETEEESHKETHNETESQQQQTQDKQGEDGAPVPSDEPQTQHVRNDVSMDMTSSHRSVVIHAPSGLDNGPSKMPLPKPRLPKRPLKPISPQKPALCSPVQLRQRVLDVAASAMSKPLTNDDVTPTCSAYHEALSALSTSAVTELVGRETEQKVRHRELSYFILFSLFLLLSLLSVSASSLISSLLAFFSRCFVCSASHLVLVSFFYFSSARA